MCGYMMLPFQWAGGWLEGVTGTSSSRRRTSQREAGEGEHKAREKVCVIRTGHGCQQRYSYLSDSVPRLIPEVIRV